MEKSKELIPMGNGATIWGWIKTLVPSEPQVIAGIYGCE